MSYEHRQLNQMLQENMLNDLRQRNPQPEGDPVVEALRMALEVSTPGHAGTPYEHPDHKTRRAAQQQTMGLPTDEDFIATGEWV